MRGHVRKRGKRWALVIPLGRDPATGKARQKWYSHKTRAEAEQHRLEILSAMQGGGWTPPTKMLLGDFLDQWLDTYAAGRCGPKTMQNYREIIRVHLKPTLGHVPLAALSAHAIDEYLTKKILGGTAPSSAGKHLRLLRQALKQAARWRLVTRNVATDVDSPKQTPGEVLVWDEEQTRLFLAAAKRSRHHALYLTAILCGLRSGELAGLRWSDVDLALGAVHVRQTFLRLGKERIFKAPKTAASQRTVALPPAMIEVLRKVQADQEENRRLLGTDYHNLGLVFAQPDGKPLHMHNVVRRDFRRVMEKAGVLRITFHRLRHVHASYGAKAGVPPKVMQERLGHATPGFTMRVYTHTLPGQQEAAARAVEALVFGRSGGAGGRLAGISKTAAAWRPGRRNPLIDLVGEEGIEPPTSSV
jgi:integrase